MVSGCHKRQQTAEEKKEILQNQPGLGSLSSHLICTTYILHNDVICTSMYILCNDVIYNMYVTLLRNMYIVHINVQLCNDV